MPLLHFVTIFLMLTYSAYAQTDQKKIALFSETSSSPGQSAYVAALAEGLANAGFLVSDNSPQQLEFGQIRVTVAENEGSLGLAFLQSQIGKGDVAAALLSTPGAFPNLREQRIAQLGIIGDAARDEIREQGVFALGLWPHSTDTLVSTAQIASIESFFGIRAVTADPYSIAFMEKLGAEPMQMTFAEVFAGLQTGVVNAAVVPQSAYGEELLSLFGNGTVVPEYKNRIGVTLVSSNWWRALTAGEQRRLLTALKEAEIAAAATVQKETDRKLALISEREILAVSWQDFATDDFLSAVSASITSFSQEDAESILRLKDEINQLRREQADQDLYDNQKPEERGSIVPPARVFFASNRRFDPAEVVLADRFANTEDPANKIRCGELAPPGPGSVGEISEDVNLVTGTSIVEGEDCVSLITSATLVSGGTLLFYIHGFRNSFEDATKTGLAFSRDAEVDGVVLIWTWPSGAALSSYLYDEESVVISEPSFLSLVSKLVESRNVKQLSFLAHSMGSRFVSRLMRDAWIQKPSAVAFAAPDVSRPFLKQAVEAAQSASVSLFATEWDRALLASRKLHRRPRAGRAKPLFLVENMETIDLSAFDRWWSKNHGHVFSETEVVDDLKKLFKGDWNAVARGLTPRQSHGVQIDHFVIVPDGN